ncbi:hypothetical protein AAY473_024404 [Plecturocebus cupreus]
MQRLVQYREVLLEGLKKGAQRATNINKASEVIQGKEESPAQFYERLCEAYHMYTPFDPESPKNQCMANIALVRFEGMNTQQLLEIAYQVFVNRDAVSNRESQVIEKMSIRLSEELT